MNREASARAQTLIAAGRYPDAIRLLGSQLAAEPGDTESRRLLGWAQLGVDDRDGALRSVQQLAAAAPDDVDTHLLAAAVHSARREIAPAQQAARTAIRLAPSHPAPYRVAAGVDIANNLVTDSTVALARKAIELDPNDADAHRIAGTALLELRRRKEAGDYLKRAAALDPQDTTTAAELSRWHAHSGRSAEAARGFAAVVRADPTDRLALANLRVTVWRTFSIAQLVLWIAMVVIGRIRLLTSGDPESWVHVVGPIVVVTTLAAWAFLLRSAWRGVASMLTVVRTDRTLQIGLGAHLLCLFALICATLIPGGAGETVFFVAIVLLVTATVTLWIKQRQVKREEHSAG